MAQFLKGKNQFHQEQYKPFDFVVEFPEAKDTPLNNVAISVLARTIFKFVLFFVDSEGVWVMMPDPAGEYQMGYIAAMLTRSPLDQDLKSRERVLAKNQKEAEDIFYKKYPRSYKANCALWESDKPLSFQNKSDIEDCKRKIEMYKEKLEKLKKETPKDLVKVETGFDG